MKDLFPEFYEPSTADMKKLWKEGTFVLDASLLLNVFDRMGTQEREDFFRLLERLEGRLRA